MNMGLRWVREGKIWCCIVLYFEAGFEGVLKQGFFQRGRGRSFHVETKDRKGTGINSAKYSTRIWKVRLLKAVRKVQVRVYILKAVADIKSIHDSICYHGGDCVRQTPLSISTKLS